MTRSFRRTYRGGDAVRSCSFSRPLSRREGAPLALGGLPTTSAPRKRSPVDSPRGAPRRYDEPIATRRTRAYFVRSGGECCVAVRRRVVLFASSGATFGRGGDTCHGAGAPLTHSSERR